MDILRKLKIHCKFRSRTRDSINVPEIRLEGKWLEELGFEVGGEVTIKQEQHKLTITTKPNER